MGVTCSVEEAQLYHCHDALLREYRPLSRAISHSAPEDGTTYFANRGALQLSQGRFLVLLFMCNQGFGTNIAVVYSRGALALMRDLHVKLKSPRGLPSGIGAEPPLDHDDGEVQCVERCHMEAA